MHLDAPLTPAAPPRIQRFCSPGTGLFCYGGQCGLPQPSLPKLDSNALTRARYVSARLTAVEDANLPVVLLIQAPPSQELEPPTNPAQFRSGNQAALQFRSLAKTWNRLGHHAGADDRSITVALPLAASLPRPSTSEASAVEILRPSRSTRPVRIMGSGAGIAWKSILRSTVAASPPVRTSTANTAVASSSPAVTPPCSARRSGAETKSRRQSTRIRSSSAEAVRTRMPNHALKGLRSISPWIRATVAACSSTSALPFRAGTQSQVRAPITCSA
jgi:hypothetical protein